MKICYLADSSSIHTQKWVKYFASEGHDIHVISFAKTEIPNATCHQLPLPSYVEKLRRQSRKMKLLMFPIKFIVTLITLRQLIKQINPDVLHAHYITNYGLFASLTRFKPLVVTAWGSDILTQPTDNRLLAVARQLINRYVLKFANLITCDAEHMKQALTRYARAHKIKRINFGIDIGFFAPTPRENKQNLTVVSTRRLEPIYNVGSLIEAVPTVVKKIPVANFKIVGAGSQEEALKRRIKELGVEDYVMFMGAVENEGMPNILNEADVYVSTSLSDAGISASTAEAMACGLPIVITDNAENRKWIQHGCLIPNNDVESLEKALIQTLEIVQHSKGFGIANRKIIEEQNNFYKEMAKMETLYKDLTR